MSKMLDKIKEMFHSLFGKKNKMLPATEESLNSELKPNKKKNFFERITNIGEHVNEKDEIDTAIQKMQELDKERIESKKRVDEKYQQNIYSNIGYLGDPISGKTALLAEIADSKSELYDIIKSLYDDDKNILLEENSESTIEKIKNVKMSPEQHQTFFEKTYGNLKELINEKNIYIKSGTSLEEFTNNFIESIVFNYKEGLEIGAKVIPEKLGIEYALLRSLHKDAALPDELKSVYKDCDEYRAEKKEKIIDNVKETINFTVETPSEKKALGHLFEKGILEQTALMGDSTKAIEIVKNAIMQDRQNGDINPESSQFGRDFLREVINNLAKGARAINPNNKSNEKFTYFNPAKGETMIYDGGIEQQQIEER